MTMIDTTAEKMIRVGEAANHIPGHPHVATVWRWALRGVRGVKLETVLVGAQRFTSHEAIERFIVATTAKANGESAPVRTPRQRERAIDRAEKELAAEGI
jgi:hypothetical protein